MIRIITGDCRDVLPTLEAGSVHCVVTSPPTRDENGRFKKGHHWRTPKPYWDHDWLYNEYITKGRSASEIASDFDCHPNNILHFLHKHNINRRTVSEARVLKHWGSNGEQNPMYGKIGEQSPNWKGGITPERQALYSSLEWTKAVKEVWIRDDAICQRCGKYARGRGGKDYHIHHIAPFSVKHLRADLGNLILFCKDCHIWVHSKENAKGEFVSDS